MAKTSSIEHIVAVTIPLSKPTSFEAMLEHQRNKNKNDPYKKPNKISIESVRKNDVKVQIGMYKTLLSAERDMPNILLLNIDLWKL